MQTFSKTEILTKLKYSKSNKTQKFKSITTFQIKKNQRQQNSNGERGQTQNVIKLKIKQKFWADL